jgi:YVTN family beta-propeller protein
MTKPGTSAAFAVALVCSVISTAAQDLEGTLVVANRTGGSISFIDLSGELEAVVFETGAGAEGLAVSPDGSEVRVTNRRANSASVIDTQRRRVVGTIEEQILPGRVEISAAGRVLIPTGGAPGQSMPQVSSVYDVESNRLVDQHIAREAVDGPGGFSIHNAGEIVFAADRGTNRLLIYDPDEFPASRVLIEGQDSPDGLVYSPLRMNVLIQ